MKETYTPPNLLQMMICEGDSFQKVKRVATAVAIDASGLFFIADATSVLSVYEPHADGQTLLLVHIYATPCSSTLYMISSLSFDQLGNLLVVDQNKRRICVFDPTAGKILSKIQVSDKPNINPISGIVSDSQGNIIISDYHFHRILVYTPEGKLVRQFGQHGNKPGDLYSPAGVAIDRRNENIVVVENRNHRVSVFNSKGELIRVFGTRGTQKGQLSHPYGLAVGQCGRIVVADTSNDRVQIFNDQGDFLMLVNEPGFLKDPALDKREILSFIQRYF